MIPLYRTRRQISQPCHCMFFLLCLFVSCEDCLDVSEQWDELAEEWEGHEVGVIAQADCADENALPICNHFQVEVRKNEKIRFQHGLSFFELLDYRIYHLLTP
jgi:hypothetical protein